MKSLNEICFSIAALEPTSWSHEYTEGYLDGKNAALKIVEAEIPKPNMQPCGICGRLFNKVKGGFCWCVLD